MTVSGRRYADWLKSSTVPKLAFVPNPGGLLSGERLAWCRTLSHQQEVEIPGIHWLPEESALQITSALQRWVAELL